jgi:hypothetical protein
MVISTKWKLNYHCSQNKKNRRQPILHRRPNHPQTQKIAALKAHKKGLMQQLFPTVDDAAWMQEVGRSRMLKPRCSHEHIDDISGGH